MALKTVHVLLCKIGYTSDSIVIIKILNFIIDILQTFESEVESIPCKSDTLNEGAHFWFPSKDTLFESESQELGRKIQTARANTVKI